MSSSILTCRLSLPTAIPPGGVGVIFVDGRVAEKDWLQGPGQITPDRWQAGPLQKQRRIEAAVIPDRDLRLAFAVEPLFSAESVALALSLTLDLTIVDPVKFLVDIVRDQQELSAADLAALLAENIRASLQEALSKQPLAALHGNPRLRQWLATAIAQGLEAGTDLRERSGLEVRAVDAYDLRCRVWDEIQQRQETLYLQASLAGAEAAERKLLDEQVLAVLRRHVSLKEELVEHKEKMAELIEREAEAETRTTAAQAQRRDQVAHWVDGLRRSTLSALRPELWRHDLDEGVATAPLYDAGRVFVITRTGRLRAFAAESGQPLWPRPLELGNHPGEGMAIAAGKLWIPGHDGMLYAVDPGSGAIRHRSAIGGRLSSAPVPFHDRLLLSVDVTADSDNHGCVVPVDPQTGAALSPWRVTDFGLRASPAVLADRLFVGDRHGRFFALDPRRGHVDMLFEDGGKVLGAAAVDPARRQIIIGDLYGRVRAFSAAGEMRWASRLAGQVVGRPLVHGNSVIVGAGDGRVHTLGGDDGQPRREPYSANGPIVTSPLAWLDWVFVGSNDNYLHALDTQTDKAFWTYSSGSPIFLTPALDGEGRVFVVDQQGHVSALPWHHTRYADAARRMEEMGRHFDALKLWMRAGVADAALVCAEKANHIDIAAEIAAQLDLHDKAARYAEQIARIAADPLKAASWWIEAADQWTRHGDTAAAQRCLLADANARRAPLLSLTPANLPALTEGRPETLQVLVRNLTAVAAQDVTVHYRGHVQRAGHTSPFTLSPNSEHILDIAITPSASGSAELELALEYSDMAGNRQRPQRLHLRLAVARPPETHYHINAPAVVNGDGIIILREGSGRSVIADSGGDTVDVERSRRCPKCGAAVLADDAFCEGCGGRLEEQHHSNTNLK